MLPTLLGLKNMARLLAASIPLPFGILFGSVKHQMIALTSWAKYVRVSADLVYDAVKKHLILANETTIFALNRVLHQSHSIT